MGEKIGQPLTEVVGRPRILPRELPAPVPTKVTEKEKVEEEVPAKVEAQGQWVVDLLVALEMMSSYLSDAEAKGIGGERVRPD